MMIIQKGGKMGRLIDSDHLKETLDYYIREAGWGEEINKALGWVRNEFIDSEPTAQPEMCEDAVSRRRLLNDLKELITAWEKYPFMAEQIKGVEAAIEYVAVIPSVTPKPEQRWIPCKERLPEEDNWLGGSGKQFSDHVLISILNSDDEDEWVNVSCTIDGEWTFELPRHCKILAWMPLPEPYREEGEK